MAIKSFQNLKLKQASHSLNIAQATWLSQYCQLLTTPKSTKH